MAQREIGTIQALWRYPVKSLRGEALTAAALDAHGIVGDRVWALRELDRGGIVSARVWAGLLQLGATYNDAAPATEAAVAITLPDGRVIAAGDPASWSLLAEFLGRSLRLEKVRRERPTAAEIEAVIRGEAFPPARDFFDEDVVHLIANGTLAHLRTLQPGADFDPRRFRANIYVDTGATSPGFIEDGWLDGRLMIGDAVQITGLRPALRCVMTTHQQGELPRDMSILRTAAQHHSAYVGVFAAVARGGTVRVGDPVRLEQ